ncbi:MAG: PBSX family phage terminase large subunit [Enterorhabdus sp.]|nr:PBSX family phage terminase large subunit [Enterorhabdus sp.]
MLTPKQEAYCLARTRGLSQRQAYREAYPSAAKWKDSTVDTKAYELERNGEILDRLAELRQDAAKEAVIDRAEVLGILADVCRDAADLAKGASDPDSFKDAAGVAISGADKLMRWLPEERADEERPAFAADFGLLIGPSFLEPHRAIASGRVTEVWEGGGRGSLKSSHASLEVVNWIEQHPMEHAAVFMKQKANLRDGAYAQVVWAINALGLEDEYELPESTLRIVKRSTGQLVLFRGCDNPKKIKSIKVPFGHIGIAWFEEADMFRGLAELRSVGQSVSRGGGSALRIYTFNPPLSKTCWINEHVESGLPDYARYWKSTYLEAPPEWLGPQFIADAEELKRTNPRAHAHEYLGDAVGLGDEVFGNAVFREVTDEETAAFDNLRCGQDFGWYPDPWFFTISEWQPAQRRLITWYEDSGNKLQPWEQAERIRDALTWADWEGEEPAFHDLPVRSDDAEPGTISAQREHGVSARAAQKGGMRDRSYRFLQTVEWVIDPARCPRLAAEVRGKQYERSAARELLNSIPDGDDHGIDSVRYAVMREARSRRGNRPATEGRE